MNKKLNQKLRRANLAIVAHIFASGPALELEEYLKQKVASLIFIGHPFSYLKDTRSFFRKYEKGKLIVSKKSLNFKLPEVLLYFKDAVYTILWIAKNRKPLDLYIGSDNFSSYLGIILKRLGFVRKVILYTIDYVPSRFSNPLLNFLYHYFDKVSLRNCDVVWNVSSKISEARKDFEGLDERSSVRQIVVPLGIWYDRYIKLNTRNRKKYSLVFLGHLLSKQGLGVAISALPKVLKVFPKASLTIIGTGPYEARLKEISKKLDLSKVVKFTGYVKDHKKVEEILSGASVSLATYQPDPGSFTYYADPGKIKNYLAAGLPIILTDVPQVAKKIEEKKCGLITAYSKEDIASTIIKLFSDENMLKAYSQNSTNFAKEFDWNIIFYQALSKSL